MKILHIVSNIGKQSGVMKVVMSYYKEMYRDFQFDFLYWDDSYNKNYLYEIEKYGGNAYKVNRPSIKKNKTWEFFFNDEEFDYNIVHLHMCFLNSFVKKLIRKQTPLICHAHTDKFSDKLLSAARNKLLCMQINNNCDYKLACSEAAGKNYFGINFINNGKIILNALDFSEYNFSDNEITTLKSNMNINDSDKVYIHIGGFRKQKNHEFLIEVFENIIKNDSNSILLLVGDGPLKKHIQKIVLDKKIEENVKFLGVREDVPKLLAMSDIFLFPSIFEGLGIVLIEAQIANKKVFCSDVIPREAFVTNLIQPISLGKTAEEWAKIILESELNKTVEVKGSLLNLNDYNISLASKTLKNIYLEVINKYEN